jgi:hypothetical protein
MRKLRTKTLSALTGGVKQVLYNDWGDMGIGGGNGTTCGGYHMGTCMPGYFCVGYYYNDPACGLLQTLTGTCPQVVTYTCI